MNVTRLSCLLAMLMYIVFALVGCKKDKILLQGGELRFSTDTLKFDTVFTSLGSVTRSFKVYNNNNQPVILSTIRLKGGDSSRFRMNVDGEAGKQFKDIRLAPFDSIYIFVATTIDPRGGNLPFLVSDAVEIEMNQNPYQVILEAYGQDAHYIVDSVLKSQTWVNDKPYVIIHSALVDSGEVLTIQKGCRIFMHADSKLYVAGTLRCFGTKTDSIIFQGDRLDRDYFGYRDYPGEWCGIHFLRSSKQNNLNFTIIKNAGNVNRDGFFPAAVVVSPPWVPLGGPIVEFNQCIIANSIGFGVLCFNTWVRMNNCLVHTCGQQNIAALEGGTYEFNFCTISTYSGLGINHTQQPTMALLNYRDISLTQYVGNPLQATLNNCVVYGPLEDELFLNQKGSWDYNVAMNHCMIKRKSVFPVLPTNSLINVDPQFSDISKWDYRPKAGSPARQAGFFQPAYINDLDDKPRNNPPTIGCYELD